MISDDRHRPAPLSVSMQDGTYPRPQLVRAEWADLSGEWHFAYDDDDQGLGLRWFESPAFDRTIRVPFPPESEASGIGDPSFHPVVWYHRTFDQAQLSSAGFDPAGDLRLQLHFGAVDYRCQVWVNGQRAGEHEGGQSPFTIDITGLLRSGEQSIVVRAEDDPADVALPRGKQDWRLHPHSIWYHRTTGIWQPVWLEAVPGTAITSIHWVSDLPSATVRASVRLGSRPEPGSTLTVTLSYEGAPLGAVTVDADSDDIEAAIAVTTQRNGQSYEELLWSPEHPRLIDAVVQTRQPDGRAVDVVHSYLGLRSVGIANRRFLLNDRPYYLRSVLNQGYWPESHLAAPSTDALRAEAQVIKDLGFNATRLHQKFEDPRFLFWADKLGLLVWAEAPSAYTFTTTSVERMTREWIAILDRDRSHPSIVTWVPLNESWGVQHISHNRRMQHYARALVNLTKAIDPTRPVISNDGWEHVESDVLTIHDYEWSGKVLGERYATAHAVDRMIAGVGPAGRRIVLGDDHDPDAPIMLTEFGGVSFVEAPVDDAWGYSAAESAEDFAARVGSLLTAVHASPVLSGFCYTQLADTGQETNGLLNSDRTPKLPVEQIRRIVTGS
ncbi:MAG: hypothetical protein QOF36_1803 [Microbacteriaceae bacterium]|nr:hypothetical protein [Microbacteriaceae bacterium]